MRGQHCLISCGWASPVSCDCRSTDMKLGHEEKSMSLSASERGVGRGEHGKSRRKKKRCRRTGGICCFISAASSPTGTRLGRGIGRRLAGAEFGGEFITSGLSKRHLRSPWTRNDAERNPLMKMADDPTAELETSKRELETLLENFDIELPRQRISNFQTRLDKASKWLVTSATGAVIFWRHDEHALWALIGAMLTGAIGNALKYLINDKRPQSAYGRKEDPGMPSSHAQAFMYLSTYASLGLLTGPGLNLWTISSACALLLTGAYLSWLRVADGLHSVPQIIVGGILGSVIACSWLWCWKASTEQALQIHPNAKYYLLTATGLGGVAHFLLNVRNWRFDQY